MLSKYGAKWRHLHFRLSRGLCYATIFFLFAVTSRAQSFRPFNPLDSANPYSLHELDDFGLGGYGYCRWGVLQSDDHVIFGEAVLGFSHLTRGPFTFGGNPDLFISTSLTTLTDANLLQFSVGSWYPPTATGDGSVVFSALPGKTYNLFRKLHFRDYLQAKYFSDPLPVDAKKVIILIHGWNPDSNSYHYHDEFEELYEEIKEKTAGTDWHLVLYHWEEDADTGPPVAINFHFGGDTFFGPDCTNPTEAASIGHLHGQHLGNLLASFGQLEKVHLIAHSAGTWVARAATQHLLKETNKKIQITLLDPFIPGQMRMDDGTANDTPFNKALIDSIPNMDNASSDRLHSLENIFAEDLDAGSEILGWPVPFNSDWAYRATSQLFAWDARMGINQRVDWTPGGTAPVARASFYDYHNGPIQFYADSVKATGPKPETSAGLLNPVFNLALVGWRRSMFYNEPVVNPKNPIVQANGIGGKALSGTANLRGATTSSAGIEYSWEVSSSSPSGPYLPFSGFSSDSTLLLSSAQLSIGQRWYRMLARTDAGVDTGNSVEIGPNTPDGAITPLTPGTLSVGSVSSSQINLSWGNVTGETGYKIERSFSAFGPWEQIATRTTDILSFSDTGLTANTTYYYRILAFNAAGNALPTVVKSSTTQASTSSMYTLNIHSGNPDSGVSVISYVGSSLLAVGTTPTTREFAGGKIVEVTCASSLSGGFVFQKWQLNGADYASTIAPTVTSILMNRSHTLTAIYGPSTPAAKLLKSLVIDGGSTIEEGGSMQFLARANYADGTFAYVSASWGENSSYATISNSGRLDTSPVSSDKEVEIEATYSSGGVTKTRTKDVTILDTDSVPIYTLTQNASAGGRIGYAPKGSSFAAGTVVSLHANPDDGYVFSHWTGDASGIEDDITVKMNGNKSVTAHFVVDSSVGNLRVNISPSLAVTEGAQWKYRNFTAWRDSGTTQDSITPGDGYVYLKDIPGWVAPKEIRTQIVGGQTVTVNAAYQEITSTVQVTLEPNAVTDAGGQWRLNGGTWQASGTSISGVSAGSHQIEFKPVAGWSTPATQQFTVSHGETIILSGAYGPPVGLAFVTALYPKTGPLSGGTTVTIEGAGFNPGTTVEFGGVAATLVNVIDPSKLTAVVPARASYGSVGVTVRTAAQTINLANAFAYLNPLGANMELVGQMGGDFNTVAVTGNMVFVGEGTSVVAFDYTTPTAPVERGRIALPSLVNDIFIVGTRAYVADADSGLYVLDIAIPTSLSILGFYDLEGTARGVCVDSDRAYVANGFGLEILDVANPGAVTRLGGIALAGSTHRVAFGAIGGSKLVFVAHRSDGIRVVDVTHPASLSESFYIAANSSAGVEDVKFVGNTLYVGDWAGGVRIFNVVSPTVVNSIGVYGNGVPYAIDVVDNRLYVAASSLRVANVANPASPGHLGTYDPGTGGFPEKMVINNGLAFIAKGRSGLTTVAVSNPAAMALRSWILGIGRLETVSLDGGSAFLGGDTSGLQIVDVSQVDRPVRLGNVQAGTRVSSMIKSGSRALLVDYGSTAIRIADVSNPTSPNLLSTYSGMEGWDVALKGTTAVVVGATKDASHRLRLELIDYQNSSTAQMLGGLTWGNNSSTCQGVAVGGNSAFVAVREGTTMSLTVVDISNTSSPSLLGTVVLPSPFVRRIAASPDGRYAYAAGNGVHIIDTLNPGSPQLVNTINPVQAIGENVFGVATQGTRLFFAANGYLFVYDVSNPTSPVELASYNLPGLGYDLRVAGDVVFVADTSAGLTIVRLLDVGKPTLTITGPTLNSVFESSSAAVSMDGIGSDDKGVSRVTWFNSRGGSGEASGLNTWSINGIILFPGENVITVTAYDSEGNSGTDQITVNSTQADSAPPVVVILGPNPNDQFVVNSQTIALTGKAADNQSVANVSWSNDRGGTGSAVLNGQNWIVADLPLAEGPNLIKVTATDANGGTSSDSAVIFYAPVDTQSPTISIEFPTLNAVYETESSTLNLSGVAADNATVTTLTWSNNRGGKGVLSGADPWSVNDVPLEVGLNVIEVTATDESGNTSSDTLAVLFSEPIPALSVSLEAGKVVLGWPSSSVGFSLESSTDLLPENWTLESLVPSIVNGQFVLTNDVVGEKRFYRLKK